MTASASGKLSFALECSLGGFSLQSSLDLDAEPVALVGPNGCGKTSLLLALLGIHRPTRGRIVLGDEVLFDSATAVRCPTEARRLAYLPQDFGLFPFLTSRENVEFAISCRPDPPARGERRRIAVACLERFAVGHLAARKPRQLSGGECQRVALARTLAAAPRALLFDEPTASLDVGARAEVRALLAASLHELAIPTLIVTHDQGDILALARRVAVMENGRIIACTSLADARRSPANAFAARLLDAPAP